jgi:DNA polymerase-3 subunit epsilon
VHKNGEVCYNFGKYQGRSVREILKTDPAYHHWVLEKEFALHTKQKLRELIESFGGRSKARNTA